MKLIAYYIAFVVVGDLADYFIGLGIERFWPEAKYASLVVFLSLYFLVLWFSWILAVWMTEPKRKRVTA